MSDIGREAGCEYVLVGFQGFPHPLDNMRVSTCYYVHNELPTHHLIPKTYIGNRLGGSRDVRGPRHTLPLSSIFREVEIISSADDGLP